SFRAVRVPQVNPSPACGGGWRAKRAGWRNLFRRRSSRAQALARCRVIGHAGMARAIGQALDRLVAAEAEAGAARLADRPASLPLVELKQRAMLSGRNRRFVHRHPGLGAQGDQDLMLGDELRLRQAGGAAALRRTDDCRLGAREPQPVELADYG